MNKSLEPVLPDTACNWSRTEGSRATRTVVAVSLGNWLQLYDFTAFSFFAVLIGKLYFPLGSAYGSLLSAQATFGISFLMRPLGSVVIGRMADQLGRRKPMLITASLLILLAIPPCFWLIEQYPGLTAVLLLVSIIMALQAVISPAAMY